MLDVYASLELDEDVAFAPVFLLLYSITTVLLLLFSARAVFGIIGFAD